MNWEFGVSLVPVILCGLAYRLVRVRTYLRTRSGPILGLLFFLLVPVVLTIGPDWWGRLLLNVPVLRNSTTFVRWWLVYIMPLIVIAACAFDVLARTPVARAALLTGCVGLAITQLTVRNVEYYTGPNPSYNPSKLLSVERDVRRGGRLPSIERAG